MDELDGDVEIRARASFAPRAPFLAFLADVTERSYSSLWIVLPTHATAETRIVVS